MPEIYKEILRIVKLLETLESQNKEIISLLRFIKIK